jgi:hypothetical protein
VQAASQEAGGDHVQEPVHLAVTHGFSSYASQPPAPYIPLGAAVVMREDSPGKRRTSSFGKNAKSQEISDENAPSSSSCCRGGTVPA